MLENFEVTPWAIATIAGPILFALVLLYVLTTQHRRGNEPVTGDFTGPSERPRAATNHPKRTMAGLGGRGWSSSGWALPVFVAVLAMSAIVFALVQ